MRSNPARLDRSWSALLVEGSRVAVASRVVSGLIATLSFVVPLTISGTAGFSVDSQTAILRRVDEVGSRILTVVSSGDAPASIPATAVDRIARLGGVAWVVGLGPVSDVRNRKPAGETTPLRTYRAVRAPVVFSSSAVGGDGFVSATSARRAGLAGPYSVLDPVAVPIVGWFRADEPLGRLEDFVLVPTEDDVPLERIIIATEDVGWVEPVAQSLSSMLGSGAARGSTIERSPQLLSAREAVRDEVASRDRMLIVVLLAVTTLVAGVVIFAGTISSRRDFGRRRALGATQPQLVCLVVASTVLPAMVGALLGAVVGWLYLSSRLGHLADPQFSLSVAVLTVLSLAASSAAPAAVAATRDPLKVLRVP